MRQTLDPDQTDLLETHPPIHQVQLGAGQEELFHLPRRPQAHLQPRDMPVRVRQHLRLQQTPGLLQVPSLHMWVREVSPLQRQGHFLEQQDLCMRVLAQVLRPPPEVEYCCLQMRVDSLIIYKLI